MRILQLSDTHLRGDHSLSFRVVDTRRCLDEAVAHVKSLTQQPDIIVITGDLADSGDLNAYHILHDELLPFGVPVYAVPGNHDRRDRLREVMPHWCPAKEDIAPYLCYTVEEENLRLIMMDSMSPGSHSGHFPAETGDWLERELAKRPDTPTMFFMHHPPFVTGMGAMDEPFENVERFAAIVERNPQMRLSFGHMHRPIVTEWHGRIAMTAPAVSMQIDLDLSPEGGDNFRMETPGYLLHHFDKGVWNSHICQIAVQATFAGPYPFAGSVNPTQ
ncbi:phosphodiesterase [Desulfovibrio sp. UIB00]|uniref:phosphodiesterase n=1 Tax=Desulfovibrio sp. UIB00 TaxID=2804314 RepID=UPI001F0D1E4D|nr:phosphodiesterase [Desulfovibrio sp. UIB00]MCH5145652.1 phosphodiesterase [Desulfovibrio sp. UIB00]